MTASQERSFEAAQQCARRAGLELRQDASGVVLAGDGLELRADFAAMKPRLAPGRLAGELLVKAARIKGPHDGPSLPLAVDATAGLGEDALLLAAAGFAVRLYERNPVTAALLRDALRRGANDPGLAALVGRMELCEEDGAEALLRGDMAPDLVYLDPMFPAKHKNAATKKKLQMLQKLEQPCAAEEVLLQAALAAQPRKVVVKRPLKGPHLAGMKPSYALEGKVIRYDCLVLPR